MPISEFQRIKVSKESLVPLPPPPSLAAVMKGKVVTREDVIGFDVALKRWWETVQVSLRNNNLGAP